MIKRALIASGLAFVIMLVQGCGDSDTPAPEGSTITINPPEVSWVACSTEYNFTPFNITVRDANGVPLQDVDLYISLDLSTNTHDGLTRVELYDDPNWDGNSEPHPSTFVASPYHTKTDESGTKRVLVKVFFTCEYKASLNVYSGASYSNASIEVTAP